MREEDKLGTLEEAIEFDKKRNYQYTAPTMKEEALKLAEDLEYISTLGYPSKLEQQNAIAMIRRLVARIEFSERFAFDMNIRAVRAEKAMQTKPLSDEEIWEWFEKNTVLAKESALMIARAIEERHGIK